MFDFAWSEIALIAVVAMIAIGPKDMPVAIRAVTGWIKKARRMAAEFQTHVDEMVREADLSEVRASINEIRNFDIRGEIEKTIDADGSIRVTFASNPLEPSAPAATSVEEIAVSEPVIEPSRSRRRSRWRPRRRARRLRRRSCRRTWCAGGERSDAVEPEPPAFIPPDVVQQRRARPSA